jgi:2-polyprenyl-6-methoxyphenol hydroxylase-like FAD-dependent oxidoreductase
VARLERKGVRVRWNHRLASLSGSEDGVVARVDRLEKESGGYAVAHTQWVIDSTKEFRAAFVVGADGHRSMVRRALGARFDEVGPSQVFAAFECAAGGSHPDQPSLVLQGSNVNVMWPLEHGRSRWSLERSVSVADADDRFKSRLTTQMGERYFPYLDEELLRAMLIDRAPWFGPLSDLGWSIEIRFERRLASLAGRERIWLAGDALHTTAPAGMQSMNAGLREASSLASCITRKRRGGDGGGLFDEYGRACLGSGDSCWERREV